MLMPLFQRLNHILHKDLEARIQKEINTIEPFKKLR